MSSGIALKNSIKKYGIENFVKEILYYFDDEKEMFQKELELVDADFVLREDTYNLSKGGTGFDRDVCVSNGIVSKKIKKDEFIPDGWKKGRIQK